MLKPDEYAGWISHALKLADRAAALNEVPVGAIVVRDGRVVGEGINLRESEKNPLGHAELAAIRAASLEIGDWRLLGCSLVVTLEPCPMCLGAAQQARVDEVIFGAKDPKGGAISLGYALHEDPRMNHRYEARYVQSAACEEVLRTFFRKMRSEKTTL